MRRSIISGRDYGRNSPRTLQRTQVDDPITGKPRKFSGFFPDWQWELDVRRDRGPLSFGFSLNDGQRFTFYRTDEFDTNFNGGAYGTAFVEYRPSARTAITFDVDNVLNTTANSDRLIFWPNRAAPIPIVERVSRAQSPFGYWAYA